jgi:2,3-bisphosphoglycerate-dependent phosphoglycerate mutase
MTFRLILLRHGESAYNQQNRFTGWLDVPLAEKGMEEARHASTLIARAGLTPDVVHTSVLRRAIRTSELALEGLERSWIPVRRSWRLNERHYGALQGKDKKETLSQFGEEKFMQWRRSFDVPPPPLGVDDPMHPRNDARYKSMPPDMLPATECLKDVLGRMLPYWHDAVAADLALGHTVMVVAHGNSLRALVKHLDGISDSDIVALNIPTGIPLYYELDAGFRPVTKGGRYLDPAAAAAAAEAVKNQGR